MSFMLRIAERADLMASMIERTQVDMTKMTAGDYGYAMRQVVSRCAGCKSVGACHEWLETASLGTRPPDFCPNAAFFESCRPAE